MKEARMLTDQLRLLIDKADVVSFDVFDTLLLRSHFSPTDVFAEVGSPNETIPFRLRRIAAERIARLIHRQQEDISLTQIYAFLNNSPDQELTAERKTLFANQAVRSIYEYAVANGKQIIVMSDMYLSESSISDALAKAGYTAISRIYVSGALGKTKASGSLFRHVIRDLGIEGNKILHIGDNQHSDYHQPVGNGIEAVHILSPRASFECNGALHPRLLSALRRRKKPSHSLILGLMRDGLVNPDVASDYWYTLGYSVVGPVINAYAQWLKAQADVGGHAKIFFLARDGHLPQQVFSLRYPTCLSVYTFASRRLFLVPALEKLDEHLLDALCGGLPGTLAREYWNRLGINIPAVSELLEQTFSIDEKIWSSADRKKLQHFFIAARPLIAPHALREKNLLRRYFSHLGMFESGVRPLLVDVGWRASSQRFLETALPELAGTTGAYFGLTADGYRNGAMKAFFFDGDTPAEAHHMAMHCVEIIELMFSAPDSSIRGIRKVADGNFESINEPDNIHEQQRTAIVQRLHDGAIAFTQELLKLEARGYSVALDQADAAMFIKPLILHPTARDTANLGALPHALGLGQSSYETLLPDAISKNPLSLFSRLLGSDRKRLYWPRGLVNACQYQYGYLHGFCARVVITSYSLALRCHGLLKKMLPNE